MSKKAPKKPPKKPSDKASKQAPKKVPKKVQKSPASAAPDPLPEGALDDDEMRLWRTWRVATERVGGAVQEEIRAETGLSDPEVAILASIAAAGGSMRQNELAARLDWHRSRLSHQLTRMEGRGLVMRTSAGAGVEVRLTVPGETATASAGPVHDRAVRAHLVSRLSTRDRRRLLAILQELGASGTDPPPT